MGAAVAGDPDNGVGLELVVSGERKAIVDDGDAVFSDVATLAFVHDNPQDIDGVSHQPLIQPQILRLLKLLYSDVSAWSSQLTHTLLK